MAIAPPDGTALSCRSLGRVMSRSWSSAVSKNPPAGSANRSRIRSARPRAIDEPALVERRLVQRQQALGEVGVVLEHALPDRPTVLPRPPQRRRRGVEQAAADGPAARDRRGRVALLPEQPTRLGEGRDGQPVPGRERLVVAGRLRPRRPARQQPRARPRRVAASPERHRRARLTRDRIVTPSQLPSSVTP